MLVPKNCSYCQAEEMQSTFLNMLDRTGEPIIATFIDNDKLYTSIIVDGWYEKGDSYTHVRKINFCPMCGRKINQNYKVEKVEMTTIFDL